MAKRVIGTRFQGGTYDLFVNPSYSVDVYACQYNRTKTSGTINYLDGDVRDVTTGSDADAIHKSVTSEINSITAKTTPVDNDITIIEDSAVSYAKKKLSWSNIKGTLKSYFDTLYATVNHTHTSMVTGSGTINTIPKFTGANAIGDSTLTESAVSGHISSTSNPHNTTASQVGLGNVTNDAQLKRAANDFTTFTEKTTPVDADVTLIEDSANSYAKKKLTWSNIKATLKSYFDGLYATLSHTHTNMITGSGTSPRVAIFNGTNSITSQDGFEFDGTNKVLKWFGNDLYGVYGIGQWFPGYLTLERWSDSTNPYLLFYRKRLTSPGAVKSEDILGRISAIGHNGTDFSSESRARLDLVASEDWSSGHEGAKIQLQVTPSGSTTPVLGATIDGNGIKNELTNTVRTKDYTLTIPATGTAIEGSGTANTIPKFTGANTIGDSSIIDGTNLTFSKNVDFAKYKAIAMACDNGSTLPTSPATGQWFLHTPTGRKVLMMYNGSSWTPIISFGNMILYVDGASGSDSPDNGYGTGANAFATIQYAVNMIPSLYSGNVYLYIATGTYTGFTIGGKMTIYGNYTIYIEGTLSALYSGTITSAVQGSAENHTTITVSGAGWTANAYKGKLANWGSNYAIIRTNTTDTLTLVGCYTTPSGTLTIYDWGTVITTEGRIDIIAPVQFKNIRWSPTSGSANGAFIINNLGLAMMYRCNLETGNIRIMSYETQTTVKFTAYTCFISVLSNVSCDVGSLVQCYVLGNPSSRRGVSYENTGGYASVYEGLNYAYYVYANKSINLWSNSTLGYNLFLNNNIAIFCTNGGQAINTGTGYCYYSGNTTDRYANTTSYGYYS